MPYQQSRLDELKISILNLSKFVILLFVFAIFSLSAAPIARAGTISASFTGTFLPGAIDTAGFFGVAGTNLAGHAISGVFNYAWSGANTVSDRSGGYAYVVANPSGGLSEHPIWTANISANGNSFSASSSLGISGVFLFDPGSQIEFDVNSDPNTSTGDITISLISSGTFSDSLNILHNQSGFDQYMLGLLSGRVGLNDGVQGEYLSFTVSSVGQFDVPAPSVIELLGVSVFALHLVRRRGRAGGAQNSVPSKAAVG